MIPAIHEAYEDRSFIYLGRGMSTGFQRYKRLSYKITCPDAPCLGETFSRLRATMDHALGTLLA